MLCYKQYVDWCESITTEAWKKTPLSMEEILFLQADAPYQPDDVVYCLDNQKPYTVIEYQPHNGRGGCFWLKNQDGSLVACHKEIVKTLPHIKVYRMYKNRVVEPSFNLEDHGNHYMVHIAVDNIKNGRSNMLICYNTMVKVQGKVPTRCAHPGCDCTTLSMMVQLDK